MGAKACGSNPAKCCTSDGYYKNHDVDITAIHHSRRSNFKSQHMFICQTPRNQKQNSANDQYISNNKRNTYQFCVRNDDDTDTDNMTTNRDREHISPPTLHNHQTQPQFKSNNNNNARLRLNPNIQSEPFGISTKSMNLVLGMKGVEKLSGGASPTPDWSPRHKNKNKNRNIPIVVPQHYHDHVRSHSNSNSPHSADSPYSPYSPRHQLVQHHLRISPIDEQAIMDDIELSDTADIDASIDTMDKQEMKLQLDEMDPFEDYNPFDVIVPNIMARQGMDKSEIISPKQDHVIQPPGVIIQNRRSSKTPQPEIVSNIISPLSVTGPNSVSPHSLATMARNYDKDRSGRGQRQASMDTINSDQISIAYDDPDQENDHEPNVSNSFPDINTNITPRDTEYKMDVEPIKVTSTRMGGKRITTNVTPQPRPRANTTGGFKPKSSSMSRSTPMKHRVTQTMIFNEFDLDEEESNTPTSPFYDHDAEQMDYKINILSPIKGSPTKSPALQRSHSQHIRSKAHNDIYDGTIPMFDPSGKGIELPPISLTRAQSDQRSNLMRKQSLTTWKEHEIIELENEMKRELQMLKRKSTSQSPRNIGRVNRNLITTTLPQAQSNLNNHTIYVPPSKVVQHGHTHQPQVIHNVHNNVMAQLSQGGSEGKIVYGSDYTQRFTSGHGIAPIQLSGSVNSYGPPQPYNIVMDGVDLNRQGTTPLDDDAEFEMELDDLDTDTDTDEGEDEDEEESELSEIEGSFNGGSTRDVSPLLNDAPPSNLLRMKSANKWETKDISQQEMAMMEEMKKLSSAHLFESH